MWEENISVYISSGCFSDNNSFLIFSRVLNACGKNKPHIP